MWPDRRGVEAQVQRGCRFAPDAALSMRTFLPGLGAEGMARRMAVLEREGLVK